MHVSVDRHCRCRLHGVRRRRLQRWLTAYQRRAIRLQCPSAVWMLTASPTYTSRRQTLTCTRNRLAVLRARCRPSELREREAPPDFSGKQRSSCRLAVRGPLAALASAAQLPQPASRGRDAKRIWMAQLPDVGVGFCHVWRRPCGCHRILRWRGSPADASNKRKFRQRGGSNVLWGSFLHVGTTTMCVGVQYLEVDLKFNVTFTVINHHVTVYFRSLYELLPVRTI